MLALFFFLITDHIYCFVKYNLLVFQCLRLHHKLEAFLVCYMF